MQLLLKHLRFWHVDRKEVAVLIISYNIHGKQHFIAICSSQSYAPALLLAICQVPIKTVLSESGSTGWLHA
jgi:hypothetical protein